MNPETEGAGKATLDALAKGGVVSISSLGFHAGAGLIAGILLARGLGAFSYGLYSTALTFARTVSLAVPLGMPSAIVRFAAGGSKKDTGNALLAATIGLSTTFAGALLIATTAPLLAKQVFSQPALTTDIRIAALLVLSLGFLRVLAALSRLEFDAVPAAIGQQVIPAAFAILSGMIAILVDIPSSSALGITTLGALMGVVYLAPNARRRVGSRVWPLSDAKHLIGFGIPAALSVSLSFLLNRIDRFVLAGLLEPDAVGIYTAAAQLALLPAMAMSAVNSVLSPFLGKAYRESRIKATEQLYSTASAALLVFTTPFFVVVATMPGPLLSTLYGSDYVRGAGVLMILSVGQFANIAVGPIGTFNMMSGREREWVLQTVVANMTCVVLAIWLVPIHGMLGGAIAGASAIILLNVGALVRTARKDRFHFLNQRYLLGLLVALFGTLASLLLFTAVVIPNLVRLATGGVYGCMLAFLLSRLVMSSSDRATIRAAIKRG